MQIRLPVAFAALLPCAIAQTQADIAFLQNGAHEIIANNSGSLVVFGDQAFPVVNGRSEAGRTEPVIAAARLGKGRLVAIGGNYMLEQNVLQVADTGRMVANIVRWSAGEKSAPRVGVYRINGLAGRLKSLDFDARDIDLSDRNRVDMVLVLARLLQDKDVAPLQDYVRGGGGLVVAGLGSYLADISGGRDFATEAPVNRLASPAGIVWGRYGLSATSGRGFRVEPPPELSHAARAVAAFEANEAHRRFLSLGEQPQAYTTLLHAISDLPHDSELLSRLDQILAPFQASAVPSPDAPIAPDDYPWRLAIMRTIRQLRWTAPENVRAHPAAAAFPGAVPPGAPRVTATVHISASQGHWGWFGTGLYAAPGDVVTVRAPGDVIHNDLTLVIGIHIDKLWHLEDWPRMPEIVSQTPIQSAETRAANAFGGAIYISVPKGSQAGDFDVTISGGVPAPRYIDGKTSLAEWRSSIRNLPAPWADIESDKIILSVPSRLVRELDDPAALMKVWNQMSDLVCELAAVPKTRLRPERLVPDVEISGGIQHSGYPIMMHLPKAPILLDTRQLLSGSTGGGLHNRSMWGMPHELSHNVQNPAWSFDGSVEATAQLFAVYVLEKLCGIPVASNPHSSPEFRAGIIASYFDKAPDFDRWKRDQFIGLTFYIQLQQAFGWEAFQRVFSEYVALPENQQPKTDLDKRDQWMVRFSRQVKRNLGPFFQAWGIPTSDGARASVADLPGWMPDELRR